MARRAGAGLRGQGGAGFIVCLRQRGIICMTRGHGCDGAAENCGTFSQPGRRYADRVISIIASSQLPIRTLNSRGFGVACKAAVKTVGSDCSHRSIALPQLAGLDRPTGASRNPISDPP